MPPPVTATEIGFDPYGFLRNPGAEFEWPDSHPIPHWVVVRAAPAEAKAGDADATEAVHEEPKPARRTRTSKATTVDDLV